MTFALYSFALLATIFSLGTQPTERPLLAMEVRFDGDAQPWRWWCQPPTDSLAQEVLQGFAEGFGEHSPAPPIFALPNDTAAVHPMYCTETLDKDLATNLAGLLEAGMSHSGLLEIGIIKHHIEPRLITAEIRFSPFVPEAFQAPETAPVGGAPGTARTLPLARKTAIASKAADLPMAIRNAALSVGRTAYLLRLQNMKRTGSDRLLTFHVRGVRDEQHQTDLGAQLEAMLPTDFSITSLGFRGVSSVFVLEAPQGRRTDLLGMLQNRIGTSTGGLPPLILEGFTPNGAPLFVAIDTETPSGDNTSTSIFP